MRQRLRHRVATALPMLLLGLWAAFAVVAGAPAAPSAQIVSAVAGAPATPARAATVHHALSVRSEMRRAPALAAQEVVAADRSNRPPLPPPVPAEPVVLTPPAPLAGEVSPGPRQERAPPAQFRGPRQTRAPPSSTSG